MELYRDSWSMMEPGVPTGLFRPAGCVAIASPVGTPGSTFKPIGVSQSTTVTESLSKGSARCCHRARRCLSVVGTDKLLAVLLLLTPFGLIAEKPIDLSAVYAESHTVREFQQSFPQRKLIALVEERTKHFTELSVYEDHSTHTAKFARFRIHSNGTIERLAYDDDGNELWLSDNISAPK